MILPGQLRAVIRRRQLDRIERLPFRKTIGAVRFRFRKLNRQVGVVCSQHRLRGDDLRLVLLIEISLPAADRFLISFQFRLSRFDSFLALLFPLGQDRADLCSAAFN